MADKIVQVTASKIAASVAEYEPKVVNLPVLQITAGNAQPVKITTSVENPGLAVTITNMGEESVPNPQLFKRLNDSYTGTDTVSLTYLQTKLDQIITLDQLNLVVNYGRVFQEVQVTNDSYKVSLVGKGLITQFAAQEVFAKQLSKPFSDLYTVIDRPSLALAKPLFTQVTYSEELVKVAYLKASSEIVVSAENFSRTVAYNRSFQSIADATDDFFGTANADDDQIVRVGKTVVNWVASSEIRIISVSKTLNTQTAVQEQKTIGLTKPLISFGQLSSQTSVEFTKPLVSASTLTDRHKYLFGKSAMDTSVGLEQHTSFVQKVLLHASTVAEEKQLSLQKPLFSTATNSDTVIKTWLAQRQFADSTNPSSLIRFDFSKNSLDSFVTTEFIKKNLAKVLASGGVFRDLVITQVDYKRSFTDFVASTDDFFGNANVDDDQTARVGKNLLSWLLPTDQHSVFGSKALNTKYFAGEQARLQTSKVLSSESSNTDQLNYTAIKQLLNVFSTQDQQAFKSAKILNTSFASTDTFNRLVNYTREVADSATFADTANKLASKTITSSTAAADQAITQTNFKRLLASVVSNTEVVTSQVIALKQDLVVVPDLVSKHNTKVLASTFVQQDTVQKATNKALVSQSTTSDVLTFFKFGNRIFSEIAATNDSGVINNQSYFLESYVEPGYAGTDTYFS